MSTSLDPQQYEFSKRPVGVELEVPMHYDDLDEEMESRGWDLHDDGSIPQSGTEFVSPPMVGKRIQLDIEAFYRVAKALRSKTEHTSCGVHVHINAVDIYDYISAHEEPSDVLMLEDRVHEWGMVISALSRLFVGPGRNGTRFARGGFAIRNSYPCDPPALKKLRRIEYPTVAIRENTFEFRIFPSTNRGDYTVARAAFCQASGDWLMKNIKLVDGTWKRKLASLIAPIDMERGLADSEVVSASLEALGLSGDYLDTLMSIYLNFRVGNASVLPALWLNERDVVKRQEKQRRECLDALRAAFEEYKTPQELILMLEQDSIGYFQGFFHDMSRLAERVSTVNYDNGHIEDWDDSSDMSDDPEDYCDCGNCEESRQAAEASF